jgi:hypothetical protein
MRDTTLVRATVVTDDSTGCYEVGELDFGVPGTTADWLDAAPDRPKRLADWLRMLADKCEKREAPFLSFRDATNATVIQMPNRE